MRKWKTWQVIERLALLIAIAGLLMTSLNYFRGFVADIGTSTREVKGLVGTETANITRLESRIAASETNSAQSLEGFRQQIVALMSASPSVVSNLDELQQRLKNVETKLNQLENAKTNTATTKGVKGN